MESIIKKVSVKHGEELNGRVVKIYSKKKSFKTPTKVPTTTELNGKNNILFNEAFYNPVFEITQRYSPENVNDLHKKNGVFSRRITQINKYSDNLSNNYLVKFFPQITRNTILNNDDIRSLIDLQLDSNINIISLPEIKDNANLEEFNKNFEMFWNYANNVNPSITFMPYLNLSQSPELFEKKLKILSEYEGVLHAIGIKFASIRKFHPNLITLSKFHDKDFWIHCSSSKRANWNSNIPTSQIHTLQRYNIDTASIEIPMVGGSTKNKSILTTRYFNQENITIPHINESIHDGNLVCNCPICRQQKFDELVEDLSSFTNNQKSINSVLNDFSKVHEVYASTDEFNKSQKYIEEGELKTYFKMKEGLKVEINEKYDSQLQLV